MSSPFRGSQSPLTRQQLRGQRYERLSRDLYVLRPDGDEVSLRSRLEALRLVLPDAVACLQSAALLLRLPVDDDGLLHVVRDARRGRSERAGVVTHRMTLHDADRMRLGGVEVTAGPRTFADLSAHLDLEALVAVGDVVLRRWGQDDVDAAVARWPGRRGLPLLRRALPLLDPGSDSPAETRARLRLHAAGFTRLRHKVTVTDDAGGWLAAPDLADSTAKVAVQHEGLVHFTKGERQRRHDVDRDELTRAQGWEVVISTAVDDARPAQLVDKVTRAYRRQAERFGPSVLPDHFRPTAP